MMRAVIGHSGHYDDPSLVSQHDVLVHEHTQSESAQLGHPPAYTRVVLVISGDKEGAMTCRQPRQGLRMHGELLDAPIH